MFRSVLGAITSVAEVAYNTALGPAIPTRNTEPVKEPTQNLINAALNESNAPPLSKLNPKLVIEENYAPVKPPPQIPLRARPLSKYGFTEDQDPVEVAKSAHSVNVRHPKRNGLDNKTKSAYIKNNNKNEFASEIEAAAYEFYYYLCPENTTPTHALYKIDNDGNIVFTKVASDTLEDFTDLAMRPLCREDFEVDENNPEKYKKYIRFIKDLARIFTSSQIANEDDLHFGNIAWAKIKGEWRLVRIDYDMSRWPIHHRFKDYSAQSETMLDMLKSYFNEPLRDANINLFDPTVDDIENSPVFTSPATPSDFLYRIATKQFFPRYHWLGRGFIVQPQTSKVSSSGNKASSTSGKSTSHASTPAFSLREALIKASKDPIYINEKFTIHLKYILGDVDFYSNLNKLHIRQESQKNGMKLLTGFYLYESKNLNNYNETLIITPSFQTFIIEQGETALQEIQNEMKTRRLIFYKKMIQNNNELAYFQQSLKNMEALPEQNEEKIRVKSVIKDREEKRNKYLMIAHDYFIDDSTYRQRFNQLREKIEAENKKLQTEIPESEFVKVETSSPTLKHLGIFSESAPNPERKITRSQSESDLPRVKPFDDVPFSNQKYLSC